MKYKFKYIVNLNKFILQKKKKIASNSWFLLLLLLYLEIWNFKTECNTYNFFFSNTYQEKILNKNILQVSIILYI